MSDDKTILIQNIGQLISFAPLVKAKKFVGITQSDLGAQSNAWVAIRDGKIEMTGSGALPEVFKSYRVIDAKHQLVVPGFIDAHSHPIFAGNRSQEFAQKLAGKTYQEIAAAGGGIQSTVKATRNASKLELAELTRQRLDHALRTGVTTIEAKSGYGLSVEHELKLLEVLNEVRQSRHQHVEVTCLALHAVPFDQTDKKKYIDSIARELLPEIQRRALAKWVDAFVEKGYFEPQDCDSYFARCRELGLNIRIHADEFADSGAASAAARWSAASADHLQMASAQGIRDMAAAGTVAIILPGTSLYSKIPFTNARRFIDAGCAVAVATDFNPGSCLLDNISLAATIAAVHCQLSGAEALAAVTWIAARSLRLEDRKGALVAGYDADLLVMPMHSVDEWIADLGRRNPQLVLCAGEVVHKI
jgi:imidazolonepropionase